MDCTAQHKLPQCRQELRSWCNGCNSEVLPRHHARSPAAGMACSWSSRMPCSQGKQSSPFLPAAGSQQTLFGEGPLQAAPRKLLWNSCVSVMHLAASMLLLCKGPTLRCLLRITKSIEASPSCMCRKSAIGRHTGDLAAWLQLALFLVQERAQPSSQWGPYVQSLPEDPDLLVLWPEGDLQLLEGSQLLGTVLEYRFAGVHLGAVSHCLDH